MKLTDIFEQIGAPVGASSIATPPAGGPAVTNPATNTNAMAAAAAADRKKQVDARRQQIPNEIATLRKEIQEKNSQIKALNDELSKLR
jgi:septal ring factor EnvC (AmiA/AmiB activator)